jgi:5-methylcytosine-specific restriction enzyme A
MPVMPPTFRAYDKAEVQRRAKEADRRRGSARARGYSAAWDKASKGYLRSHPTCEYHALEGLVCAAEAVDHLFPHKQDTEVFWFKPWWVATCHDFHNRDKQAIERQGPAALIALARRLGRPTSMGEGGGKSSDP